MEQATQVELPGRQFITGHTPEMEEAVYYYTTQQMGLELFGEPDSAGLYTLANVRWWHRAQEPREDSPLESGDPCFCVLAGFSFAEDRRNYSLHKRQFKSLDDLLGMELTYSTMCPMCSFHIYIKIARFLEY